jgi:hypothetical protein
MVNEPHRLVKEYFWWHRIVLEIVWSSKNNNNNNNNTNVLEQQQQQRLDVSLFPSMDPCIFQDKDWRYIKLPSSRSVG